MMPKKQQKSIYTKTWPSRSLSRLVRTKLRKLSCNTSWSSFSPKPTNKPCHKSSTTQSSIFSSSRTSKKSSPTRLSTGLSRLSKTCEQDSSEASSQNSSSAVGSTESSSNSTDSRDLRMAKWVQESIQRTLDEARLVEGVDDNWDEEPYEPPSKTESQSYLVNQTLPDTQKKLVAKIKTKQQSIMATELSKYGIQRIQWQAESSNPWATSLYLSERDLENTDTMDVWSETLMDDSTTETSKTVVGYLYEVPGSCNFGNDWEVYIQMFDAVDNRHGGSKAVRGLIFQEGDTRITKLLDLAESLRTHHHPNLLFFFPGPTIELPEEADGLKMNVLLSIPSTYSFANFLLEIPSFGVARSMRAIVGQRFSTMTALFKKKKCSNRL